MKCVLVLALAVVLVVDGKVVPASNIESQQTGIPELSEQIKEAQNVIYNLGQQIQEKLNISNQEEIFNSIKEQSTNLATNVQEYIKTMSEEFKSKSPELENLWSTVKTKLSEVADNLNVNPETTEQISQLRERFQEGLQTIVAESNNAAKSISDNSSKVQEDIAKFTKQAIDLAVQASQNLNKQLQETAQQQS